MSMPDKAGEMWSAAGRMSQRRQTVSGPVQLCASARDGILGSGRSAPRFALARWMELQHPAVDIGCAAALLSLRQAIGLGTSDPTGREPFTGGWVVVPPSGKEGSRRLSVALGSAAI